MPTSSVVNLEVGSLLVPSTERLKLDRDKDDPRKLTNIQPLRFALAVVGLNPRQSILNSCWKVFVGLCVVAAPVLIFVMTTISQTKYPKTALVGIGLLAVASIPAHFATMLFLNAGHMETAYDVARATGAGIASRKTDVRNFVWYHSVIGIFLSLLFVAYWEADVWVAFEGKEEDHLALLIAQSIVCPFNIASFFHSLTVYAIMCGLHRHQCAMFVARMRSSVNSVELMTKFHQALKYSFRTTSKNTYWTFSTIVIYIFSILYMSYGYWKEEQDASQYNGVVYIVAAIFPLLGILLEAGSATGKSEMIKEATSTFYSATYDAHSDLFHFMTYLLNSKAALKIADVAVTPAISSYIVFGLIAAAGGFIREAIDN